MNFSDLVLKREILEAHRVLDRYSVPKIRTVSEQRGPFLFEREITLTLAARIELLASFHAIPRTAGL